MSIRITNGFFMLDIVDGRLIEMELTMIGRTVEAGK
jgi:hypothetical protein